MVANIFLVVLLAANYIDTDITFSRTGEEIEQRDKPKKDEECIRLFSYHGYGYEKVTQNIIRETAAKKSSPHYERAMLKGLLPCDSEGFRQLISDLEENFKVSNHDFIKRMITFIFSKLIINQDEDRALDFLIFAATDLDENHNSIAYLYYLAFTDEGRRARIRERISPQLVDEVVRMLNQDWFSQTFPCDRWPRIKTLLQFHFIVNQGPAADAVKRIAQEDPDRRMRRYVNRYLRATQRNDIRSVEKVLASHAPISFTYQCIKDGF